MSYKRNTNNKTANFRRRWPTAVDLYSGCGSVTGGLTKRHFRVIAAIDNDPIACATYRKNHPSTHLIEGDIRSISPHSISDLLPDNVQLDLLVVCAPCQPFSNQNKYKSEQDDRQKLILQSVRFAEVLNPQIIMFENVPGLAGDKFTAILEELIRGLKNIDYTCGNPVRVNAADYQVPQRRERCLLFATKGGAPPLPPSPMTSNGLRASVQDAFKGLRRLRSGEKDTKDHLHFARNHKKIVLDRLKHIPKNGGSRFSLPPHLELDCHKGKKGYPDVYGRMKWEDVAPTLTTGCTDLTKGRFVHPEDDRAITLREAARLQTFPDKYKFCGNSGQIATQIGNAVPMKLVESLAPTLRKKLRSTC